MARRRSDLRVTMADVAQAAGVSTMTVSYAYNHPERLAAKTLARVQKAATSLNYAGPNPSARSLSRGHTDSVAVVVGEGLLYAFENPQSAEFLAGVASVCVQHRQSLSLLPVAGDFTDAARIRESAADAFILWTGVHDGPLLDAILATGRPVAVQGARPNSLTPGAAASRTRPTTDPAGHQCAANVVTIDDRAAARRIGLATFAGASHPAIVSFSLESHQKPGVQFGPALAAIRFPGARQRLLGFREACEELRIDWERLPVAVVRHNDRDDCRPLVEELLAREPDAVAAMSDQLALAVLDVAREHGLSVPRQLTVSGWDDSAQAREADLTSVHQDLRAQGVQCAELALGLVAEATEPQWSVVSRGSTRR